jgi:hypothetical protein
MASHNLTVSFEGISDVFENCLVVKMLRTKISDKSGSPK